MSLETGFKFNDMQIKGCRYLSSNVRGIPVWCHLFRSIDQKYYKEHQQMNIHIIIHVKKLQEFDAIQVLFKRSSIFQRFD